VRVYADQLRGELDRRRRSKLPVSNVRRGKRNARTPGTATDYASAFIDRIEPIVEIQFDGFATRLRRVAGILPVECATGLLA